jgi:hypothetical protein
MALILATTATKEIIDRLGPSRRQPIRKKRSEEM